MKVLWLLLFLAACQGSEQAPPLPQDLDRQCTQNMMCSGGLLCVRLFREKIIADGGVAEAGNFTCHPACTADKDCPDGYVCFRAQVAPMPMVCVRADVIDRLDGGL